MKSTILIEIVGLLYIKIFKDFLVDWSLVMQKTECTGEEIYRGRHLELYQCANSCRNISPMFVFGTTERCDNKGCECFCETEATVDGNCPTRGHIGYDLYAFIKHPFSK